MNEPTIEQVAAAVRAVLMGGGEKSLRPAEVFAGRLLGLKQAEGLDRREREVRILAGTVVTPLARDFLKKNGFALRVVHESEARSRRDGEWGFAIEGKSGVAWALKARLLGGSESWSEVVGDASDAARWVVSAPDRGAAVLTDEASVATWRANAIPGIRAATGCDADSVARAVRRLGVNLLVLETRDASIPSLLHLLATFRRGGPPAIPQDLGPSQAPSAVPSRVPLVVPDQWHPNGLPVIEPTSPRSTPDEDRRDHRPRDPLARAFGPAERALRDRLAHAANGPLRGLGGPG